MIIKYNYEIFKEKANDNIDKVFEALGLDVNYAYMNSTEIRMPCPIHDGADNKFGFSYSTKHKKWKCFTKQCDQDGDSIFHLIKVLLSKKQDREVTLYESCKWLTDLLDCKDVAIGPNEVDKLVKSIKKQNNLLVPVKSKFKKFLATELNNKVEPSQYFLDQGFSREILQKYKVGYCNNPRKMMYLRSYAPILDDEGKYVIGVTGRIVYEKCAICGNFHNPKSKGCPTDNIAIKCYSKWQHFGFKSREVLYNVWFAKDHIVDSKTCIILESPKNVWWLEQHGVNTALCIFGLNFSNIHFEKLLKMDVRNVIIALDNDERGISAKEKLYHKIDNYFNIFNMNSLMSANQDIAEISSERMHSEIVPYINSVGKETCQN